MTLFSSPAAGSAGVQGRHRPRVCRNRPKYPGLWFCTRSSAYSRPHEMLSAIQTRSKPSSETIACSAIPISSVQPVTTVTSFPVTRNYRSSSHGSPSTLMAGPGPWHDYANDDCAEDAEVFDDVSIRVSLVWWLARFSAWCLDYTAFPTLAFRSAVSK